MLPKDGVLAILCSDLHLTHQPPVARVESNWYTVMEKGLDQLHALKKRYQCPIICAGDIFDRWSVPPELISFAIRNLPYIYTIPGQHDLPYHSMRLIQRSAYWTLVEARIIHHLETPEYFGFTMIPIHWDEEISPPDQNYNGIKLAVLHAYIWIDKHGYQGAPKHQKLTNLMENLKGYDAIVVGDNHDGFYDKKTNLLNCGTFFRRKSSERHYQCQVGLLMVDGKIIPHRLTHQESWAVAVQDAIEDGDFGELASYINRMTSEDKIDYQQTLLRVLENRKISKRTKRIIMDCIERTNQ